MKMTQMAIPAAALAALLGLALWLQRQSGPEKAESVSGKGQEGLPGLTTPEGVAAGAAAAAESVTPEMLESLTTATAQIVRGDGSREDLRSIDGEFDRVQVAPNERLKIRVALRGLDASRPVWVEADNGGSLNQRVGPLVLQPAADNGAIEFGYAIGGNTGRYTLFVSQGGRQELLEFRAGPEPPTGQSGPTRIFNPEHT